MSALNNGGPAFPFCPGQDGPMARKFIERVGTKDFAADKCWPWTGAKTRKGYGVFAPAKTVQFRAHRFSLRLYLGREPSGYVLHRCDNPECVNPLHLEEGTHGDNMRQMAERRRATREDRHHKAKVNWNEAAAISLLHLSGDYSTRDLVSLFPLSQPTIAAICAGTLWPDAHAAVVAMLSARSLKQEGN